MDAASIAARAIKSGEADLIIAGGVESMSRAPFVLNKSESAFSRDAEIFDTTIDNGDDPGCKKQTDRRRLATFQNDGNPLAYADAHGA